MSQYIEIMDYVTQDKFMILLGLLLIGNMVLITKDILHPFFASIQLVIHFWLGFYYIKNILKKGGRAF